MLGCRCVASVVLKSSRRRVCLSLRNFNSNNNDKDHHADFQAQMKELDDERKMLFGDGDDDQDPFEDAAAADEMNQLLKDERQALYGFTKEETSAWKERPQQHSEEHMNSMRDAISRSSNPTVDNDHSSSSFTHVDQSGGVTMVDVGSKETTRRVARAQSKVVFPPEVMKAFDIVQGSNNTNELVGKKGPIFTTAKLAGIMAAKQTSNLIPLCHPLPLDKVQVDIELEDNVATVICECRVNHKTGVEMEALTGASVAALTIYDMVKAVSHRVEIQDTKLLTKTGGKRKIEIEQDDEL